MVSKRVVDKMYLGDERKTRMETMFQIVKNTDLEERKKLKAVRGAGKMGDIQEPSEDCLMNEEAHQAGTIQVKRRLSPEEYAKVKKRKKENDLLRKEWPRIFLNWRGKMSCLSRKSDQMPLFMGDVQSLMFFSLLGNKFPLPPRFVTYRNVTKVPSVVMVHIEGVGVDDIKQIAQSLPEVNTTEKCESEAKDNQEGNSTTCKRPDVSIQMKVDARNTDKAVSSSDFFPGWLKSTLPTISGFMNHGLEVVAPSIHGLCPVEELLEMQLEKSKDGDIDALKLSNVLTTNIATSSFFKNLSKLDSNPDDDIHPDDKFNRLKLLLKPDEFVKLGYPLPMPGFKGGRYKDFVFTSDNYKEVTSRSPMFGMDCEMCLTSINKLELASISVVNEKLECIYHTLVLPYNKVVNYLTKFSGITKDMLQTVTKRLENVQKDLQKLLPPDAILVGHGLCNDFNATKIYGSGGHDPTEDASASLQLVQWKLKHDETYGNMLMGWVPPTDSYYDWEKMCPSKSDEKAVDSKQERKDSSKISTEKAIGPFRRTDKYIFQELEHCNLAVITTARCFKNYLPILPTLSNIPLMEVLSGNKQVSQRARDFVPNSRLTFIHMEMGIKLSQCPNKATRHRQLRKLDKRLHRIHKAAIPKSIHVYVFSGSSLNVPFEKHSNGFVLVGIKDLPFKT
ncbi:uncharacterized protein LOC123519359 isoform X2 [Portunus trituberculatus]|uniref:uncharacterized protein LOC123519359 isoform X2 n=1 Tax=Portunus trituberculatus TaxID=210409 RepID=UPI001E1CC61D|nr:uncharacterized protein LOC123519359 isoform X2 [Portunus trituberculatus]